MKKLFGFLALIGAGFLGLANSAKAAADTDLTSALASTTAVLTDNKGTIITFFVGIFTVVLIIVLVRKGLGMAKGQIAGSMGGRRRRR